ncbi:MAG TPA: hypothetical protein ENI81_03030, partial [Phycisphaerales bacterium]|nr:hypothetical protein [Phycisphaerales bacterium]
VTPRIRLYPPAGSEEVRGDVKLVHQLAQSGTYKIVIQDDGLDYTGGYTITFFNLSSCAGVPIACDQTISEEITTASDMDVFQFEGRAGNQIVVNAVRASGGVTPRIRLYPPAGSEEVRGDVKLAHQLAQSGTYKIVIHDDGLDYTGRYTITLSGDCDGPNGIVYVDITAAGANNGTSWLDAYLYLQDALAYAGTSQTPVEIRVAQGVYTPDRANANPDGTEDRNATFHLINGVIIEGGYAGIAGADPDARDVNAYESILSGDLLGDDITEGGTYSDNSYHVVTANQADATAVLDGFTIMAGNADANDPDHAGGGLLVNGGNPAISNCVFLANQAGWTGGGAFCQGSGITFSGCTFVGNTAAHGAGLYHSSAQNAVVQDSVFTANESIYEGGALALDAGSAQINNCEFQENVASWNGGAIFVHPAQEKSHEITHCDFTANTALAQGISQGGGAVMDRGNETALSHCIFQGNRSLGGLGGAVYCDGATTNLVNCTFAGNFANAGHALACDAYEAPGDAIISNCILWDGGEEIWIGAESIVRASYSDIQTIDGEVYPGTGNIDLDPNLALPGYWSDPGDPSLLLDPRNPDAVWIAGDYHLCSQVGRWDPVQNEWVVDEITGPCIDAGDPNSPWENEPMPNGGRINIGAYGRTDQASMSPKIYTLTYNAGPNGSISGDAQQTVKQGDNGTAVIPVPDVGYHFENWSDGSTADPRTDTNVSADITVTANFAVNRYQVDVNSIPGGSTDKDGAHAVKHGDTLTITPSSDIGYHFTGWSGDASGDADPLAVTVTSDMAITANFEINTYNLTYKADSNGSISGNTEQIVEHGSDGTSVTPIPNAGYRFVNWSDGSTEYPRTDKNVVSDINVTANFIINEYQVDVNSTTGGSTDKDGTHTIQHGDTLNIAATADAGYRFIGWSGDASGDAKTLTLTVTSDMAITANFEEIPPEKVTFEDEVDSSDGQPETYFLPPGIDDDSIWNAEGGKYYRGYIHDWGWTHTFSPPEAAPASINSATLTIEAYDAEEGARHLIYGDGVLLGQLAERDDRWRLTTFELGPDALAELMDGTMEIWMDIGTGSTVLKVALRSSTLTVNYNAKTEGN